MNPDEQRKIVFEDLNDSSNKISVQTRYIDFGLIGICFAIITAQYNPTSKVYAIPIDVLLIVSILGIVSLVLDYFQYLMGYISSLKALKNEKNFFLYDEKWLSHKLRYAFFYLKQITALMGVIILIFGIVSRL